MRERRFLIAAGTSEYRYFPDAGLPSVPRDLDSISHCFGRLGYRRVLLDCSLNPTSGDFRAALGEWFTSDDLTALDKVVFYYSGHGEKEDRHYLLFNDSREKRLDDTAISAEDLVRIMLKHSPIRQLLIAVDTCYSGDAILNASAIAGALSRGWDDNLDCGIVLFAACRPKEFAYEGRFAANLAEVLGNDDGRAGGSTVEYLSPASVVGMVNQRLRQQNVRQHASLSTVGLSGESLLLKNLQFGSKPQLPHEIRFFTGREAALGAVTGWLNNPGDARACVVTGRPGTGKSTILARLAADFPALRIFPARGRTLPGIAQEIARALNLDAALTAESTGVAEALISACAWRREPVYIAIDGLDEAAQPIEIGRGLLTGLAAIPGKRVLVASRPEARPDQTGPRVSTVGAAVEVDLDRDEYADRTAVQRYVERVLSDASSYRGKPSLIQETAAAVARKSDNVFLIARILCRTLSEAPEAVPVEALDRLSDRATAAFDEYLDRFDSVPRSELDKRRVVELLAPLAWAEGEGLPREHIWEPLARALSGREYTDRDIHALLERAGAFVVESASHGHSVYRLYHPLLAEHLRDASRAAEIHRRIAVTLGDLTPDWTQAHPYVRSWLPIHAAKGGVLNRFVEDPMFLACIDPVALSHAAALASGALPLAIVRMCRGVVFDLQSAQTLEEALSYLELHARQCGADELAARIAALPVRRRWSISWARWNAPAAHQLLARLGGYVRVAGVKIDGAPAVIASSENGVQIIDLRTGEIRRLTAKGGRAVAAATVADRPLAAVARDGAIDIWDLRSRALATELAVDKVFAVHIHAAERTLLIAGTAAGAVYVWDLERGTAPIYTFEGHSEAVMAVTAARFGEREVAFSGSKDGTVRVWDLVTGAALGEPLRNGPGWVFSLAQAKRSGHDVILAGCYCSEIFAWDPLTGKRIGETIKGKGLCAVYGIVPGEIDGKPAIISGESDGSIQVRDVETGKALRPPMKGHDPLTSAWSIAVFHEGGRTTAISGGSDGTVRAWDLAGCVPRKGVSEVPVYGALAVVERSGKLAILGVTKGVLGGKVHVLDLNTGAVGQSLRKYRLPSHAAVAQIGGKTLGAWATNQGNMSAINVTTGRSVGGHWQRCYGHTRLAFTELDECPILAAADEAPSIRFFDFSKGKTIAVIENPHGKRAIWALGAGTLDDCPVVLSSGYDGMLRIWDVETRAQTASFEKGDLQVETIAMGRVGGKSRIVLGTKSGSLHITEPGGKPLAIIHLGSDIESLAIAPESTIIVATSRGILNLRWHAS